MDKPAISADGCLVIAAREGGYTQYVVQELANNMDTTIGGYRPPDLIEITPLQAAAALMAARAHKGQTRENSGAAYIIHPVRVARRIARHYPAAHTAIAAAFLHDTLEDTTLTREELDHLNPEVAAVVAEVTDDQSASKRAQKRHQISSAGNKSLSARMVKISDKIDNCIDFAAELPPGPQLTAILCFSKTVVDRMRNRAELLADEFDELFTRVCGDMSQADIAAGCETYLASKSDV